VAENQVGDFRASLWRDQAAVVTTDSPDKMTRRLNFPSIAPTALLLWEVANKLACLSYKRTTKRSQ